MDPLHGDDPLLREARSLRSRSSAARPGPRSGLSLADAFRSTSGATEIVHDPNAANCICCAPKTLLEQAEEEARRMQREGSGVSSAKLQLLMALCALVAIGIKWRVKAHSKL